ncbi:hypothetical protein JTE90_017967 [Oedothorax gibbosus]|uniref:BHLH domain-containing protein n=1 Tax=Oedothorax gibbosus TaxID=931172 RepID=A0AAV6V881_9ARAC|nr:hypothetical protein JTE90_017967 [Oedothorax gibbosus]
MSLVGSNYQLHFRSSEATAYTQPYYHQSGNQPSGDYLGWSFSNYCSADTGEYPVVRPERGFKRRVTANRKERRRTLSINHAFAELRDCIPNVPPDTKLSKIKTLRLATSYIAYLMDLLAQEDPNRAPQGGFKAELSKKFETREERRKREIANLAPGPNTDRKSKGRTGWPQHVWALELKSDS